MLLYYNPEIRKQIKAPFPGEILVEERDKVMPDTTVLRTNFRLGRPCVLNVASKLQIEPEDIEEYLVVSEGDNVNFRDMIARRWIIYREKQVTSPVDGYIERIDSDVGVVIVREKLEKPDVPFVIDCKEGNPGEDMREFIRVEEGDRVEYGQTIAGSTFINGLPVYFDKMSSRYAGIVTRIDYDEGKIWIEKDLPTVEIKAGYRGEVVEIISDYGVELKFSGYLLEGIYGIGDISTGKLVRKDEDIKGNIVYADYFSRGELEDLLTDNPSGLIAGSINYEDVQYLKDNPLSVVIMEGFGELDLNSRYRDFFDNSEGREVVIKGYTQVRAGVVRPEIIVYSEEEYYRVETAEGKYRVVWGEHYGEVGDMKGKLYFEETTSKIRTLMSDIELDDGRIITVPYNNLDKLD